MSTNKSTPTKEQWQEIEAALSYPLGRVKLRCDGYEITAEVRQLKPLRSGIDVYVDSWIKGEWFRGGHEIPLKFYCEKKSYIWSAKQRAEAKTKLLNRRLDKSLREMYQAMEKTSSIWSSTWTAPKAFCRHIRKTCQSIELVIIDTANETPRSRSPQTRARTDPHRQNRTRPGR